MTPRICHSRVVYRLVQLAACGLLPAFVMRCDKAALNFQRGFFEGLGLWLSRFAVDAAGVVG